MNRSKEAKETIGDWLQATGPGGQFNAVMFTPNTPQDLRRLIASAPEMAAMLRELEWVFNDHAGAGFCPRCDAVEALEFGGGKHASDCPLDALLTKVGR